MSRNTTEGKKMPNIVRFKPPMDFLRAKLTLGLKGSLKYEELSMEDVQKNFVVKNIQVYTTPKLSKSLTMFLG
jgi:hypothetical protein